MSEYSTSTVVKCGLADPARPESHRFWLSQFGLFIGAIGVRGKAQNTQKDLDL